MASPRSQPGPARPLPLGAVPNQRRGIELRERLYGSALRLFAERGVEQTRVEDIVADAGASWGAFYRYFPRKEDVLLEAAVEHHRDRVLPAVEDALTDGSPARQVAELFFRTKLSSDLPTELHGVMLLEEMNHIERFAAMIGDGGDPVIGVLARVVAYGQERGELRDDVDVLTQALALVTGVLVSAATASFGPLRKLIPDRDPLTWAELCLEAVWAGLEPRPSSPS
jgi:AcrR family transcriptional regulator